jgi:hypothetical protein
MSSAAKRRVAGPRRRAATKAGERFAARARVSAALERGARPAPSDCDFLASARARAHSRSWAKEGRENCGALSRARIPNATPLDRPARGAQASFRAPTRLWITCGDVGSRPRTSFFARQDPAWHFSCSGAGGAALARPQAAANKLLTTPRAVRARALWSVFSGPCRALSSVSGPGNRSRGGAACSPNPVDNPPRTGPQFQTRNAAFRAVQRIHLTR